MSAALPEPTNAAAGRPSRAPAPGSGAMFDRIAARYDLLNRLMSLGADRRWRRRTVQSLDLRAGARVLDVATGTGDLLLALSRAAGQVRACGLDPSGGMLRQARRKQDGVACLVGGDAQALPFPAAAFDAVTIAFGIRNVPDRSRALLEMRRVTRPGGRIAVLELVEPRGALGLFARPWVHHVVPRLGAFLSGAKEYRYLQQSIAAFPSPREFADVMTRAGLDVVTVRPMTLGAVCLWVGRVPGAAR